MPTDTSLQSKPLILVVDDEMLIRSVLGRCLMNSGYRIEMADSGESAIAKLHLLHPSLILLDINMPGMGGIAALKEITKLAPSSPVVMLTGEHDEDIARDVMNTGACDYLTKPVDISTIRKTVRMHLLLAA